MPTTLLTAFTTVAGLIAVSHVYFSPPLSAYVGFGFIPLALGLGLLGCGARFYKQSTGRSWLNQGDGELVTLGIFKHVRHPFHLGVTLILVGETWLTGNHWSAWLLVTAFVLWLDRCHLKALEKRFQERFGQRYRRYQQRVRRWV